MRKLALNKKNSFALKKLISYYRPYRILMTLDLFFTFLSSAISLILPLFIKSFINTVIERNNNDTFVSCFLVKNILLISVKLISDYFVVYVGHIIGVKIEGNMRQDLFKHCQYMPYTFYDKEHIGKLMSLFANDINNISEILHHGPEIIFLSFVELMGAFIFLLNLNWWIASLIAFIVFLIATFSKYWVKKLQNIFKRDKEMFAKVSVHIEDSLQGIRTVQAFSNELEEIKRFVEKNNAYIKNKNRMYRLLGIYYSGMWALTTFATPIVIFIMYSFCKGPNGLTNILAVVLYLGIVIQAIFKLLEITEQIQDKAAGFVRFATFLEQKVMPCNGDNSDIMPNSNSIKGNITFKDVVFKYSTRQNTKVILENLNLTINAGSHVVLVGKSGTGKTTLCNLIPRFYEIESGSIHIDGHDIKKMKISDLRKCVGILSQQTYIFSGTVSENIKYGKLSATKEEIEKAAKTAYIHEQIIATPDGYETYVGQNGANLSEGQKQRIAIARLFLKNPSILIMDEATSALDNENEFFISEALENLAKNKTTITVLHKMYTIKPADRILVLNNGEIKEDGMHNELLRLNGLYAKLYNHIYD